MIIWSYCLHLCKISCIFEFSWPVEHWCAMGQQQQQKNKIWIIHFKDIYLKKTSHCRVYFKENSFTISIAVLEGFTKAVFNISKPLCKSIYTENTNHQFNIITLKKGRIIYLQFSNIKNRKWNAILHILLQFSKGLFFLDFY